MSDTSRTAAATAEAGTHPPLTVGRAVDRRTVSTKPSLADTVRLAALMAAALTVAVGVIGVVVWVAFAGAARRWLAFPFGGVPARPSEAVSIFAHNLHALMAVGGLLLVAQSPYWTGRTAAAGGFHRWVQRLGVAALCAAVAANLLVIGAGVGAYGPRMIRSLAPDGPVELAGYALALALYRQGRHQRLPCRHVLAVAALSVAALALAAVLETYINL
jgi:hypothetical protein